jgi:hypothetical protein
MRSCPVSWSRATQLGRRDVGSVDREERVRVET